MDWIYWYMINLIIVLLTSANCWFVVLLLEYKSIWTENQNDWNSLRLSSFLIRHICLMTVHLWHNSFTKPSRPIQILKQIEFQCLFVPRFYVAVVMRQPERRMTYYWVPGWFCNHAKMINQSFSWSSYWQLRCSICPEIWCNLQESCRSRSRGCWRHKCYRWGTQLWERRWKENRKL